MTLRSLLQRETPTQPQHPGSYETNVQCARSIARSHLHHRWLRIAHLARGGCAHWAAAQVQAEAGRPPLFRLAVQYPSLVAPGGLLHSPRLLCLLWTACVEQRGFMLRTATRRQGNKLQHSYCTACMLRIRYIFELSVCHLHGKNCCVHCRGSVKLPPPRCGSWSGAVWV